MASVGATSLWPIEADVSPLARIFGEAELEAGIIQEAEVPEDRSIQPHVEYQTRPVDWIVEKLGINRETICWKTVDGYAKHVWDGTEDPLKALLDALAEQRRVIGVESGNGTGKSFLLACVILWFLACWRDARVFTLAPKEDQLKLYIWGEISRLWPRFVRWFPTAKLNHLEITIEPENKIWGAWGYPVSLRDGEEVSSKASGMHGEHMLIVTEETQGMDPRVMAALEATCTDEHNIRVALGNPNFPADELHKFCIQPGALHIRISAVDHPNVVSGRRIVPGATTRVHVDALKRKHGPESRYYKTRVRGLCPDGGGPALDELTQGIHLVPLKSLNLPPMNSGLVTIFGWLDWGHGHPWSFGKYACWFDPELGRDRVAKLETIGGHRMRVDRVAKAIKDEFPDVTTWDYLGAGSDIKQKHVGRTATDIPTPTIQENLLEAGLYFATFIDDGPHSRMPRLNNFRKWIAWQGTGPVDPETGRNRDGVPAMVFVDTPGNRECVLQCQEMITDPKKPEIPKKRDANPETGEGGDDMFDETMNALASRPFAEEPMGPDVNENVHPGFETVGTGERRRRKPRHQRIQEEEEDDSPFALDTYGYDQEDSDEEDEDWWKR